MESLLVGVAALACPIGMGVMMWLMMRGPKKDAGDAPGDGRDQVEQLRAEIEQLKADRAAERIQGGQ